MTHPFTIFLNESLRISILRDVSGYMLTDLFLRALSIRLIGLCSLALMIGMLSGDLMM